MVHMFDVDVAAEYGINCAVILQNLYYWIEQNRANERNFYDGHYWTYNSARAFAELFPYLSPRQITTALDKLKENGLIITGNYNKSAYDRTMWYALTEKGKCIMQKCKMDDAKMSNGLCENVEPIPDINTDYKPAINTNNKKPRAARLDADDIFRRYTQDEKTLSLLHDWLDVRKAKRAPKTERALTANLDKLEAVAKESSLTVNAYLEAVIMRGWAAFYAIPKYGNQQRKPYSGQPRAPQINPNDYDNGDQLPF